VSEAFDVGDCARVSTTFTAAAGGLEDPTDIFASFRPPDGSVVSVAGGAIIRDSQGLFHTDIAVDQEGVYWVRFWGTGVVVAAEEISFTVRAKRV